AQRPATQIGHPRTPRKPLKTLDSTGVSKTREKRARNTIAQQKTVGKTSKHPTASQHPGVSATRHHICNQLRNQPSTHQPRWKREEASRGRKEAIKRTAPRSLI
ncbi:hypothetical protein, partial [uncultured Bifidobacterium sp.]|uniref:hypothetical protein n=1 Tax=uncultured Bifidobacterium sp. TaxID=165187 RepID=UPI00265FD475